MTIKRIKPNLGGKNPSKVSISSNFLLFQFGKMLSHLLNCKISSRSKQGFDFVFLAHSLPEVGNSFWIAGHIGNKCGVRGPLEVP